MYSYHIYMFVFSSTSSRFCGIVDSRQNPLKNPCFDFGQPVDKGVRVVHIIHREKLRLIFPDCYKHFVNMEFTGYSHN